MRCRVSPYLKETVPADDLPAAARHPAEQSAPATTRPDTLKLSTDDGHWTLTFPAGFLSQNTLVQLDLERAGLLE